MRVVNRITPYFMGSESNSMIRLVMLGDVKWYEYEDGRQRLPKLKTGDHVTGLVMKGDKPDYTKSNIEVIPTMQLFADTYDAFDKIRAWAANRGIYKEGDTKTQYVKLMEEAGEVGRAILKSDREEMIDGLGDMVVVLVNLAELCNLRLEDCIASAYDIIAKRSGKMTNGTFVKDGDSN